MAFPLNTSETLADREREIIEGLQEGLTNAEIADRLFIASSTVKWYVRQLNQKFGTSNRNEIVRYALEHSLLAEDDAPAPTSYTRAPDNLPRQTTPFVGRDSELDDIYEILDNPNVRLLTILAPGGMGKTRIALEATEQQKNNFRDGVYFVALHPLSDVENIIPQVATSIGYTFSDDGRSAQQQVLDYLATRKMLLLMDNWEHILDGVPVVNEILQAAPDVKVIATSREKLNVMGETVYALQGMQFPIWETSEDALRYDAVQLLLQSAQRARPDWQVTVDNLDYVARVCRLTQGMPLGILLATSWMDVYSLERIAEEIQKSADILETEMRDVPERQRSIRVVFEYSWERLKPAEQAVLMKMSIFRGGCSPQSAEAITGANPRQLQALVNKALLTRNAQGRYDIHELLRQYADEQLQASGDYKATQIAHLQHYAEMMQTLEAHLQDRRQVDAIQQIDTDFENVRLAWLIALAHEQYDALYGMAEALSMYEAYRNRSQECENLYEQVVQKLLQTNDPAHRRLQAKILTILANSKNYLSKHDEVNALLEKSIALLDEAEAPLLLANTYVYIARAKTRDGLWQEALDFGQEALRLYEQVDDLQGMARAHFILGYCYAYSNESDLAEHHTMRAYEHYRTLGAQTGMASALTNLGARAAARGDWEATNRYYEEALVLREAIGLPIGLTLSLARASHAALMGGDIEEARNLSQKAYALALESGFHENIARTLALLSVVASYEGKFEEAFQRIQEAEKYATISKDFGTRTGVAFQMGGTLIWLGRYEKGRVYLSKIAKEHDGLLRSLMELRTFIRYSILLLVQEGQYTQAIELWSVLAQDPVDDVYLAGHAGFRDIPDKLMQALGEDAYNTAWERGRVRDLQATAKDLLADYWGIDV
jgi:predicted ATPase/DNA-binding CsgD family transcriptional regulator